MTDIVTSLRKSSVDGTVPCWIAEEAAAEIKRLWAELDARGSRWADGGDAMAGAQAGM